MEEKMLSNGNFSLEYETERLILRVLTPEYANEVAAFQADNRTIFEKYEPSRPEDFYTPEHQQLILKAEFNQALRMSTIRYYVFLKSNPWSIIGTVCLHDIRRLSYSCCEIGYKFDSKFTGNGYAREAVDSLVAIAFSNLKIHRVFARVMPENAPSIKLLQALNFISEGTEYKSLHINGTWEDHLRFAKLNPQE